MSLWDQIKSGLEEGLTTLSEKTTEMSKLAKMKWERRTLQKEIHQALCAVGQTVYDLGATGTEASLAEKIAPQVEALRDLEPRLAAKEAEIEDFTARIDKKQVKGLKKDLEMGDGTIEQIVVGEGSPLAGKKLMDIRFPKAVLVGTIVRDDAVIIPDGKTVVKVGDKVTLLGKKDDVEAVIAQLGA